MSANAPGVQHQAIVRVIPGGGTANAVGIRNQMNYISRNGDLPLERSDRYFADAAPITLDEVDRAAADWARHAAVHPGLTRANGQRRDLTTHIVVSLPRTQDAVAGKAALRAFAFEMFGSGRNGGQWDYVTAFHTDRPHPHLHIMVNRMSHEGKWLKISRRDPFMNYDNMRAVMSDVAHANNINLDYTTRAERGIIDRPVTFAEYRRRSRDRVGVYPQPTVNVPVEPDRILRAPPAGRVPRQQAVAAAIAAFEARGHARDGAAAAAAAARAAIGNGGQNNGGGHNPPPPPPPPPPPNNGPGGNQPPAGQRGRRRQNAPAQHNAAAQRQGVETRAQRARREAQEAAQARVAARRAERERQAELARRQQPPPPIARTRAAQRELDSMNLRSGTRVDHSVSGPSTRSGNRQNRNDHDR